MTEDEKALEIIAQAEVNTASFPSHFSVVVELRNMIDSDTVSIKNVADIVRREPVIAGKVVASANSAAMGIRDPISDVDRAVARIGFEAVKRIVIAVTMLQLSNSKDLIAFNSPSRMIWLNSIYAAAAGSVVARNHTSINPEEAFFACLALNIGAYFVFYQASKVKILKSVPGLVTELASKTYLQRTQEVLKHMGVPPKIQEALDVKDHYPNPKSKALTLKDIVVIANDMAALNYPWNTLGEEITKIEDFTVFAADLDDIDLEFAKTRASFLET